MTQNQLTYASNVETERHNRATEGELERHNRETENIQSRLADTERDKARALERYQERQADIQEQYNYWYEKYQTASTEEKLEIERRLADLKEQQNQITEDYNQAMVIIGNEANALKRAANDENRRHNEAGETISAYQQLLAERRVEYENTFWRETVGQRQVDAAINYLRTSNEYEYNMGKLGLESGREPLVRGELFYKAMKERAEAYPTIAGSRLTPLIPHPGDKIGKLHYQEYLDMFR